MKIAWISAVFVAFVCFFQHGDAAITIWTEPSISTADGTATIAIDENQATSTTIVTFAATSDSGTATYTLSSAVPPFAVASTGELTITAALVFATTPSYTLLIVADDSATTGTATVTVNVIENVAPAFATSYSPCIVDGSTVDTTLVTVSATDANSADTVTYGLTATDFKIDSSSGLIQVNTGITLDKATTPSYTFDVTATDGLATVTTTVTVTVADSCSSAVGVAISLMVLLAVLMVNIF